MPIKTTYTFRDGSTGWSETYYFAGAFSGAPNSFYTDIAEKRSFSLATPGIIVGVRAGDTDFPKLTRVLKLNMPGMYKIASITADRAEQPHVAALVKMTTSNGVKRFITLPGIPDIGIERNADTADSYLTADYIKIIKNYIKYLTTGSGSLMIRERRTGSPYDKRNVKKISKHTDGRYLVELDNDLPIGVGDKITLTKIKGNNLAATKGIRKITEIVDVAANPRKFTIDGGPREDLGEVIYNAGGKIQKVSYDYLKATEVDEPYILSTRKRGRPFTPRRGRRSASR